MDNAGSHQRRSIRLRGWDYTWAGAYFVTICTQGRECLLGRVESGQAILTPYGQVVSWAWYRLPRFFHNVALDAFVIMPNHLHGIIILLDSAACHGRGGAFGLPDSQWQDCSRPNAPPLQHHGASIASLGTIIQNLKSISARRINRLRGTPGAPVWQRNYYERIIRNERELDAVRRYIEANPAAWEEDAENPTGMG